VSPGPSHPRAPLSCEVAVVGGGPVGMLLAAELAHHGVAVTVVERNERTLDVPKAGTLHARTAQSLRRRGYLEGPEPATALLDSEHAGSFHFAGLPGLTITGPAVEGEPIVGRAQGDLERLFERVAGERGATVLRGHRITAPRGGGDGTGPRLPGEACGGGIDVGRGGLDHPATGELDGPVGQRSGCRGIRRRRRRLCHVSHPRAGAVSRPAGSPVIPRVAPCQFQTLGA